jgi:PIN domain nuclease of toxin-antitoxin system
MGIPRITVDTHTLIWFLDETLKLKKLSQKALELIREAEHNGIIFVPAISLMEVIDLAEKGRISISFYKVLSEIAANEAYKVIPLTETLIKNAIQFQGLEIHDRLIVATAIMTDSVLISKDREIRGTGLNVIWSKKE